jgi:DNA-binding Xre family transcriptional regulator
MEMHDPKLSIRKLAKDIHYHFDSVRRMYKDEMVQYPRDLLQKLCEYFNVQPGQLIVFVERENGEMIIDTHRGPEEKDSSKVESE